MAHRRDAAQIDFRPALATFMRDDEFLDKAFSEFCDLIDLDEATIKDPQAYEDFHALFVEWCLFDRRDEDGKTRLERFVTWPPISVAPRVLTAYAQAAATNFSSSFRVLSRDASTGRILVQNVLDGATYTLVDYALAQSLPGDYGMFAARIFRAGAIWCLAGNIIHYHPVQISESLAKGMRKPNALHTDPFFMLVNARFGNAPEGWDSSERIELLGMNPTERAERLVEVQAEYAKLCEDGTVGMGWEDFTQLMLERAEDCDGHELIDELVGTDRLSRMSDDEFRAVTHTLYDAYNLLPSTSLGGRTPLEAFEELKAQGDAQSDASGDARADAQSNAQGHVRGDAPSDAQTGA